MQALLDTVTDWRSFKTDESIAGITAEPHSVSVRWSDGRVSPFDRFWLRDNCPCAACYLSLTREQIYEIAAAPSDLNVTAATRNAGGGLAITWSDGHRSVYQPGWLRANAYDEETRAEREAAKPVPVLWGEARAGDLPTFSYGALMGDDAVLLRWLVALRDVGLVLVRDVPTERNKLLSVAHRISHIRETNFGTVFDVASKPNPDTAAYTSVNLPPHTDLPTRELQPGLQFLHCLVNDAIGGESIFVDGFAVAEALRQEAEEDFTLLATTPMEFWNRDSKTDYRWSSPILALDGSGRLGEVRFANFLRGPIDAPADRMAAIYRALRRFQAMTHEPRFRVERRLAAGDMWVFDNRRVLHARREFDPQSGRRHLQGVYVDRDELNSRLRVLERDLAEQTSE